MPNRILRDWTDSPAVNSLTDAGEKFFIRLIQKADDFGRYHGGANMLRPMLYPLQLDKVREADIQRLIAECVKAGLVRFYEAESKQVLEIIKFKQSIRAEKSKFPEPESKNATQPHSRGVAAAPVVVFGDVVEDECVIGQKARAPESAVKLEISELEKRVAEIYKRPAGEAWSYAELHALAEISRRPAVVAEIEHIVNWRRSMPQDDRRRFFPQSIYKLLSTWTESLDKARVQCPIKKNPVLPAKEVKTMSVHALTDAERSDIIQKMKEAVK